MSRSMCNVLWGEAIRTPVAHNVSTDVITVNVYDIQEPTVHGNDMEPASS